MMKNIFLILNLIVFNRIYCAEVQTKEINLFQIGTSRLIGTMDININEKGIDLINRINNKFGIPANQLFFYDLQMGIMMLKKIDLDKPSIESGLWLCWNVYVTCSPKTFTVRMLNGKSIEVITPYRIDISSLKYRIKFKLHDKKLILNISANIKLFYKGIEFLEKDENQKNIYTDQIDGLLQDPNPVINIIIVP